MYSEFSCAPIHETRLWLSIIRPNAMTKDLPPPMHGTDTTTRPGLLQLSLQIWVSPKLTELDVLSATPAFPPFWLGASSWECPGAISPPFSDSSLGKGGGGS